MSDVSVPAMPGKPADWRQVAEFKEIPNGGFRCVDVEGVSLLVCRVHSDVFVSVNNCPHQNQRMDKAVMFEYELVCPHHNACFDVRTGRPLAGPSVFPLAGYQSRVVAGMVEVDMANPDSTMDRHLRAYSAAMR